MARSITFTFSKNSFDCSLHKVDRAKLYGSRRIETLDMDGNECTLATLLDDGKTLVPSGGTALGYINPQGEWVSRKNITAIDYDGQPLETIPSSFEAGIVLDEQVSPEFFLDHSIRLTYQLLSDDLDEDFLSMIAHGAIFKTHFSYRGGIDPDPAFVMQGEDNTTWLLIGSINQVSYSKLEQAAVITATEQEDEGAETSGDELDFGML